MQKVAVLDTNKNILAPCHPARAKELLDKGKAVVYRYYPFTIILKREIPKSDAVLSLSACDRTCAIRTRQAKPSAIKIPTLRLKIDPGSREYLLEKWGRECAYCGKTDVPLQIEHINPKSRGGTDWVSNLTIACEECNQKKGNKTAIEFGYPEIQKQVCPVETCPEQKPLKDATAVNVTRWKLHETLKLTGLPVEVGSGGLTKYNRIKHGLPKTHWLDAVCVGRSTPDSLTIEKVKPLLIKATGHGSRQMCRMDKYARFARWFTKKRKPQKPISTNKAQTV